MKPTSHSASTHSASTTVRNRAALVTGASRPQGIGRALVSALLTAGASKVYATARRRSALDDLVASHGPRLVPIELDVTDEKAIAALPQQVPDLAILVNNAGSFAGTLALDGDEQGAREEIEVNYFAPLRLVRELAPTLARNGGGAVVNINSIASLISFPLGATYSASKAAGHSLTQAQRRELLSQGTRVVGVYPGPIDTYMARDVTMPKVSATVVAAAVLQALADGTEDVFPDPTAAQLRQGLAADSKAVERQIAAG